MFKVFFLLQVLSGDEVGSEAVTVFSGSSNHRGGMLLAILAICGLRLGLLWEPQITGAFSMEAFLGELYGTFYGAFDEGLIWGPSVGTFYGGLGWWLLLGTFSNHWGLLLGAFFINEGTSKLGVFWQVLGCPVQIYWGLPSAIVALDLSPLWGSDGADGQKTPIFPTPVLLLFWSGYTVNWCVFDWNIELLPYKESHQINFTTDQFSLRANIGKDVNPSGRGQLRK